MDNTELIKGIVFVVAIFAMALTIDNAADNAVCLAICCLSLLALWAIGDKPGRSGNEYL